MTTKISLKRYSNEALEPRFFVLLDGEQIGRVSIIIKEAAFVESAILDKEHQNKGYIDIVYDQIEKIIKQPLVPSPLGLSAQAERVWKRRLNRLDPKEKQRRLDVARQIGLDYGISDQHLSNRFANLASAVVSHDMQTKAAINLLSMGVSQLEVLSMLNRMNKAET